MDYFKKSLKQVGAIVQTSYSAAAELAHNTAQGNFLFKKPPEEVLWERFKAVCTIIDQLAATENASAVELEHLFHESKARDYIKEMLKLLQADDARWVRSHSVSSDLEASAYPCLDSFLTKHMMRELCSRAMKDYPRGTMSVILATAASLMRYVRYPLLPHQSVHVPLAQLITHAMRISNSSLVKGNSEAFLKYKSKVDYNLVALVSTLWRKLSDNPSLVEYFLFIDRRQSIGEAERNMRRIKSQLDAIGCLIPLMGKSNVGPYAKQAILTAVSIKDRRIEHFIVLDTNLLDNVVTELCRKYQRVLDAITSRDRLSLQGRGQNGVKPSPLQSSPARSVQLKSSVSNTESEIINDKEEDSVSVTLDAFLRVLRFCSALRDGSIGSETSESANDHLGETQSIRAEIDHLFCSIFLGECVQTVMLPSSSEQQVLSVQLLIKQMLQTLSAIHLRYGGRAGPQAAMSPKKAYSTPRKSSLPPKDNSDVSELESLSELTANNFLDNPEFMSILVSRAGAMSKDVVISTLQLLSSLLSAASFNSAVRCLLTVPWIPPDGIVNYEESGPENASHNVESLLRTLIERPISGTGDAGFGTCLGFRYSTVPTAYVEAALKRLMGKIFSFSNLEEFFEASSTYNATSGVGSSIDVSHSCTDVQENRVEDATSSSSISLLTVLFKKLSSFLTLKFDEQVALTGIISQISCLVATVLTVSSYEEEDKILLKFNLFWHLNQVVEKLFSTIQGHLQSQVPNHAVLVSHIQNQMIQSDHNMTDRSAGGGGKDLSRRVLADLDNPRIYRAIETAVLVEELMFEIRSYAIAAFALRGQSIRSSNAEENNTPGVSTPRTPQIGSPFLLSPPGGDFEYIENAEFEEDAEIDSADSELNTSCLSQLDSLLRELGDGVEFLESEYSKLSLDNQSIESDGNGYDAEVDAPAF